MKVFSFILFSTLTTVFATPWKPCDGKNESDVCTLCAPNDPDCIETAVVKTCQSGSCIVKKEKKDVCPYGCLSWYDGCNECRCDGVGKIGPCTKRACLVNTEAKCMSREKFNCMTEELWSDEKKEWCCRNKELGCPVARPTIAFNVEVCPLVHSPKKVELVFSPEQRHPEYVSMNDNGDGTWTYLRQDHGTKLDTVKYKVKVDGISESTGCNFESFGGRIWKPDDGDVDIIFNQPCSQPCAPLKLTIAASICNYNAKDVRLTGPDFGLDIKKGPKLTKRRGIWSVEIDVPKKAMEYLLVVDGVEENLFGKGACAVVTDGSNYANRQWTPGSPFYVENVYGHCGNCPPPPPYVPKSISRPLDQLKYNCLRRADEYHTSFGQLKELYDDYRITNNAYYFSKEGQQDPDKRGAILTDDNGSSIFDELVEHNDRPHIDPADNANDLPTFDDIGSSWRRRLGTKKTLRGRPKTLMSLEEFLEPGNIREQSLEQARLYDHQKDIMISARKKFGEECYLAQMTSGKWQNSRAADDIKSKTARKLRTADAAKAAAAAAERAVAKAKADNSKFKEAYAAAEKAAAAAADTAAANAIWAELAKGFPTLFEQPAEDEQPPPSIRTMGFEINGVTWNGDPATAAKVLAAIGDCADSCEKEQHQKDFCSLSQCQGCTYLRQISECTCQDEEAVLKKVMQSDLQKKTVYEISDEFKEAEAALGKCRCDSLYVPPRKPPNYPHPKNLCLRKMTAKYRCPLYNKKIITSYKSCTIVGNKRACNSGKSILDMFISDGECMCTHIKLQGDDQVAIEKWGSEYTQCRQKSGPELKKKYPFSTKKAL